MQSRCSAARAGTRPGGPGVHAFTPPPLQLLLLLPPLLLWLLMLLCIDNVMIKNWLLLLIN